MPLALLLLAASPGASSQDGAENLFRGPARCVLGYLEAVRLAGPRGRTLPRGSGRALEQSYRAARALTAPRALAETDRRVARGAEAPLAPWRDAADGTVLESFSLLEVRRAPRGAAVVEVRERLRRDGAPSLGVTLSEYLVARVDGDWKVTAGWAGASRTRRSPTGTPAGSIRRRSRTSAATRAHRGDPARPPGSGCLRACGEPSASSAPAEAGAEEAKGRVAAASRAQALPRLLQLGTLRRSPRKERTAVGGVELPIWHRLGRVTGGGPCFELRERELHHGKVLDRPPAGLGLHLFNPDASDSGNRRSVISAS